MTRQCRRSYSNRMYSGYTQVVYKEDDLRLNSRQSHSYSFFSQSASAGQSENVPRPVSNSSATTEDSSLLGRLGPRLLRMADTDGTVHKL